MFLAAVIHWHSRIVLSWELSSTLDGRFWLDAPEAALGGGVAVHMDVASFPPGLHSGR